mmetsp:Transcript_37807/g.119256  ORF Transcript_37807/g.119256 Transcript_37807/m.119256 type:complete len:293 (+) Transcript_37807:292-1170(+)
MGDIAGQWRRLFSEGLESDSWGQVEEANESYERLAGKMTQELQENTLRLDRDERGLLIKIVTAVKARSREITQGGNLGVGTNGMKAIKPVLDNFLVEPAGSVHFPIDINHHSSIDVAPPTGPDVPVAVGSDHVETGSLLPAPAVGFGDRAISFTIEKMGFKDATEFIDPYITVTVVSKEGNILESSQDTPITSRPKPNYVMFGHTVHVQAMFNKLPVGSAVFFEFKHFKPKKKKISTKAFAFMEYDEISKSDGPVVLEIYKKPTDFKRKKVSLLSVKPLYLHLEVVKRTSLG